MRIAGEPDPAPWRPLGERVQKPAAAAEKPEWQRIPDNPRVERNTNTGAFRTTDAPVPPKRNAP